MMESDQQKFNDSITELWRRFLMTMNDAHNLHLPTGPPPLEPPDVPVKVPVSQAEAMSSEPLQPPWILDDYVPATDPARVRELLTAPQAPAGPERPELPGPDVVAAPVFIQDVPFYASPLAPELLEPDEGLSARTVGHVSRQDPFGQDWFHERLLGQLRQYDPVRQESMETDRDLARMESDYRRQNLHVLRRMMDDLGNDYRQLLDLSYAYESQRDTLTDVYV